MEKSEEMRRNEKTEKKMRRKEKAKKWWRSVVKPKPCKHMALFQLLRTIMS
jgi:hypothetical protein